MNLLLVAISLLFYTKATETKECISYVITETLVGIVNLKGACEELNGVMASEDLKDSENAEKAKLEVDKLREEDGKSKIFLGITVRNTDQAPHKTNNPFVFSDGSEFNEGEFLYKWADKTPYYLEQMSCVYIERERILDERCNKNGKALCAVKSTCLNSGFERSRANFALFVAGSVFNAFHVALVF